MKIALERSGGRIGGPAFIQGISSCFPIYESPESVPPPSPPPQTVESAASCSSSIGRNSDCSGGGSDGGDESEVQSSYKGPLDTMDALEDSLPIRRGISTFYRGKSKSFTSLADALPSSSAKDLAKPENSYTRKRKNLLAFSNLWDKPHRNSLRSNGGTTVSKRPTNSSRTTLGLSHSMSSSSGSNSNSNGSSEEDHHGQSQHLPPLHPQGKVAAQICSSLPAERLSLPVRSFSLTDLEGVVSSSSSIESGVKHKGLH